MTSVEIPSSVTSIPGELTFAACTSLTSIEIPASVTFINESTFNGCSSLESITVAEGNKVYDSRNNCNAIIETETNTLIQGCNNTVIPDSVTTIMENAFKDCAGLTSINIPASLTSIGNGTFDNCTSLESITVAEGNAKYDSRNNCNAIIETETNKLVIGCKNTIIPNTVTSIGEFAFAGCTGLTNVTIPASVTSIGNYAFAVCTGLTNVTIPASVTSIGTSAFSGSTGLTSVTIYAPSLTEYDSYAFYENPSGRKIYVFSDCVDTYKAHAEEMGVDDADDIVPITLPANAGDNAGEYWTTYYNELADAKVPDGARAFKVTLSGTKLAMTEIEDGIISLGTAVVIKSISASVLPESSASASTDTNDNHLHGTSTAITNPGNAYVLNKKSAGVGFYKLTSGGTIGAHKAYLTYNGNLAREFFAFDEGGATAIEAPAATINVENGEIYDLQGRRVAQPTKGLYIKNGKKMVIK